VETVFYEGRRGDIIGAGSHYWVGDNRGEFANPTGPSATDLLWTFFRAHPFAEHPPPTVTIGSASAGGTSVAVAGTASASAGSSVAEVTVRLEDSSPQAPKAATGTTNTADAVRRAVAGAREGATPEDRQAAVNLISQQAGIPPEEAQRRLDQFQTTYRETTARAGETARQTGQQAAEGAITRVGSGPTWMPVARGSRVIEGRLRPTGSTWR